jgi:hypothetical protein
LTKEKQQMMQRTGDDERARKVCWKYFINFERFQLNNIQFWSAIKIPNKIKNT